MIRFGLVGCGVMGRVHLNGMSAVSDRAALCAFADSDGERAEKFAQETPGSVWSTDYREIIDKVDALILAVPHDLHYEMTSACLKAGKHVLLEKPLALTEEECCSLIEMDSSPNPVLMVGYVLRHSPIWQRMGSYIKERTFGEVFQVSIWTEQLTDLSRGDWLGKADRIGGGQLFSHGCHYIDLMLDWLGEPVTGCHIGTNLGTPWMEREGTSNVSIKFKSGAIGYHMGTWGARGSSHGYAVHAHCTEGMLELSSRKGTISFHRDPSGGDLGALEGEEAKISPSETVLYTVGKGEGKHVAEQLDAFLQCIEQGKKPEISATLAIRSLRTIWALYDAEDQGTLADLRGIVHDDI